MARLPQHPRLPDHNARMLRLARDYDKKYRPVVLVIGKKYNIRDSQHSLLSVRSIARETWRYTDDRKPLSERTVKRHLSELEAFGVLKPDPRQRWNGSQASSVRVLDFHQAVRFGKPVKHLWDAPLPAKADTPVDTPSDTPLSPLELSSISLKNSPFNSGEARDEEASPSEKEREGRATPDQPEYDFPAKGDAARDRAERGTGMCNTYTFWKAKQTGNWVYFRADKPSCQTPPKEAKTVTLSPEEASFMWKHLHRKAHVTFLRASKAVRSTMMAEHDRPDARAERATDQAYREEMAKKAEARRAAERAERAPLVARYCELSGRDAEDIEALPIMREHRLAVAWLKSKIDEKDKRAA